MTKPALTPEEWAHLAEPYESKPAWEHMAEDAVTFLEVFLGTSPPKQEAAAALLYGQQFGFTWDDVDALRAAAEPFWETADTHGPGPAPVLASLADRIEALLPPREAI